MYVSVASHPTRYDCVQYVPDPAGAAGQHISLCGHNWSASPPAGELDPTGTSVEPQSKG